MERAWAAVKMQARQDQDLVAFEDVEEAVPETAQGRSSDGAVHGLLPLRIVAQKVFDTPDLCDERSSEAHALRLDIRRGIADFSPSGCGVTNRACHGPLAGEEAAANLVQGEGRLVRVLPMVLQPRTQFPHLLRRQGRWCGVEVDGIEELFHQFHALLWRQPDDLVEQGFLVHVEKVLRPAHFSTATV